MKNVTYILLAFLLLMVSCNKPLDSKKSIGIKFLKLKNSIRDNVSEIPMDVATFEFTASEIYRYDKSYYVEFVIPDESNNKQTVNYRDVYTIPAYSKSTTINIYYPLTLTEEKMKNTRFNVIELKKCYAFLDVIKDDLSFDIQKSEEPFTEKSIW